MKRIYCLSLIVILAAWGCVSVDNATLIDTDQQGYATGQYRDVRSGKVADVSLFGGGAGASGAASSLVSSLTSANTISQGTGSSSSSGGGGGMFGLHIKPGPTQGDPIPFARSVAMINYSKRLRSIKYDETGGIIEYEFNPGPMSMRSESAPAKGSKMPSAFGHQPIE